MPVITDRSLVFVLGGLAVLGPLSIDAYMPAFAAIGSDFLASSKDLQLTLTGYLFAFAGRSLVHGPLSDSFGRKPIILCALVVFGIAALGCALSPSIGWLIAFRILQGLSAGVGNVIGRAIIRDCYEGDAATRLLALVSLIFSLSPALAPVYGGWIVTVSNWRVIFFSLAAYAVVLIVLCGSRLPETLSAEARQRFGINALAEQYVSVFGHGRFTLVALVLALSFSGLFLYVASVPAFLGHELGLRPDAYVAMFGPIVAGLALGSFAAERLAGRMQPNAIILLGFTVQLGSGLAGVILNVLHAPVVALSILPVANYAFGMSLVTPSLILTGLDLFPQARGAAASCQTFLMLLLATLVSQAAPGFGGRAVVLALIQSVMCTVALACWLGFHRMEASRDAR